MVWSATDWLRSTRWSPVVHKLITSAIILLAAAIACSPLLKHGASNGHSIIYNLPWAQNFSAQLTQGDLYPRWLMNMNRGAGSPAFYFYAPLPFYLEAIPTFLFPGAKPAIQLAWGQWLMLALSGASFFYYASRRFNAAVATLGAIFYMVLPYHFEINLWRRQDLGELAVYIWMPLVLRYTERLFDSRLAMTGLAISYALMLLSHLPTTFLFSLCLAVYVLALAPARELPDRLTRFAGAIGTGLLLAGIYLVPALFSEQYVHMNAMWIWYYDFHRWFFPIGHRLDGFAGNLEFATRLFTVIGVSSFVFLSCWLSGRRWQRAGMRREAIACLLLIGMAWFLMSSCSALVWEYLPQLSKVQFPWRVASIVDLAAAMAALHALQAVFERRDVFASTALASSVMLLTWSMATSDMKSMLEPFVDPVFSIKRDYNIRHAIDPLEYQTIWNPSTDDDPTTIVDKLGKLSYDTTRGSVIETRWRPRSIELHALLERPTSITVRQFYYPNWRATLDDGTALAVTPSQRNGLVMIEAPKGAHDVKLELTLLPQESIGTALSALGVLLVIARVLMPHRRHASQADIPGRPDQQEDRRTQSEACAK